MPIDLDPAHLDELHVSGIDDATAAAAGVYSGDGQEVQRVLGWHPTGAPWGRGLIYPYRRNGDNNSDYARVKPDFPRRDKDGDPIKYESPRHAPNRAYFPPGCGEAMRDAAVPVLLTEGEKKSLAAMQRGFACLGLVGVWGFTLKRPRRKTGRATGPRLLIEDLNAVHWHGRSVYIVFDSDGADKKEVALAENTLAEALVGRGAAVRVVRLPQLGEGKTGLDDFLVHHGDQGPARLRELMENTPPFAEKKQEATRDDPFPLADKYISANLMTAEGPRARYWRDEFHVWHGDHYQTVAAGDFEKQVLTWLDKQVDGAKPRLAHDVAECIRARLLITGDHDQPLWLGTPADGPADPADWIAMHNGILDLPAALEGRSNALRPHTPLWFSPNVLPYDYDPAAECPQWYQFLDEVFDGDEDRINLLAEWFGLCLVPDTRFHAIMLLEGPRRSGKGTTCRMLRRVVGEHNCVGPRLSTLGEMFGLWGLLGRTVAICPDAHLGNGDRALSILEILKSISGEDALEIHRKNLPSIPNAHIRVRFTLAVNELPKFGDSANTLMSRLLILPYRHDFTGHEDRDLDMKLAAEVAGAFNLALYGLRRLRENGRFTVPTASEEVTRDFERLTSPVAAFLEDCAIKAANARANRDVVWMVWRYWCDDNGRKAGSRDRLGNHLRLLIPTLGEERPREGGARRRYYVGIGMTDDAIRAADEWAQQRAKNANGGPGGPSETLL
jgi:putative DNA primase/helicase